MVIETITKAALYYRLPAILDRSYLTFLYKHGPAILYNFQLYVNIAQVCYMAGKRSCCNCEAEIVCS